MLLNNKSWGSIHSGDLSPGCKQCINGEKMVIFVTNECSSNCFYCPLSNERKISHISLANERPMNRLEDLIIEAELMDAKGASLTGGDPLEHHSIDKCLKYTQLLKKHFGESFHIHAYTRGKEVTYEMMQKFESLIDEVRFHVRIVKTDFRPIKEIMKLDFDIGIEIPVIPILDFNYYTEIFTTFDNLKKETNNFYFINLNELEVSETNYRNLLSRGLEIVEENQSAIKGSAEMAIRLVKWAKDNIQIPVHFCNLNTKDSIQLPNRLYRIGKNIKLPSDVLIEEGQDKGLLLRGEIKIQNEAEEKLLKLKNYLIEVYEIPDNLVTIEKENQRILTHPAILEEIASDLKGDFPNIKIGIVEEYPSYDRLQTTYIPL